MPHWTKVGESNGSSTSRESSENDVKVVSHERVKDTNPDTYIERGKVFFEKKDYKAAEKEYLEAARLSKMKTDYIEALMKFYYATRQKSYEKKADKIYKAYRKYEYEVEPLIVFGILAYGGLQQCLSACLAMIVPYFISGGYYTLQPHNQFVYAARGENGKLLRKGICAALLYLIMVVGCVFLVFADTPVSELVFDLEENAAIKLLELAVGVVSLIIGLIYFNRFITDVQKLILKKKVGLFYKLSQIVRIAGMIIAIGLTLSSLSETSYEWKKQREWDALSQKLSASDSYMDSYLERQPENENMDAESVRKAEYQDSPETIAWSDVSETVELPEISTETVQGEATVDAEIRIKEVLGYDSKNLNYYGDSVIQGQNAVLYEYVDDYGGAADFLVMVLEDGTVGKYYADGTWEVF